jgi:ribosomal protein S8E
MIQQRERGTMATSGIQERRRRNGKLNAKRRKRAKVEIERKMRETGMEEVNSRLLGGLRREFETTSGLRWLRR